MAFTVQAPDDAPSVDAEIEVLARVIGDAEISFSNEYQMQAEIFRLLQSAGYDVEREVRVDAMHRLDFLVSTSAGRIAIETKRASSEGSTARQIEGYCGLDRVDGVLLVTTVSSHVKLSLRVFEKPFVVQFVASQSVPVEDSEPGLGRLWLDGKRWKCEAKPHIMMRLKRVFPRISVTATGRLTIENTPDVALDLEWVLSRWPLEMSVKDRAFLDTQVAAQEEALDAVQTVLGGGALGLTNVDESLMARDYWWDHQRMNADLISTMKRLLITDDLGAGKTFSSLTAFRNPDSLPALIVTPTHIPLQWKKEILAQWPQLNVQIAKKRTVPASWQPPDVIIVPYSRISGWVGALAPVVKTVIFDEIQELRNGVATEKGGSSSIIASNANYVIGLTATPVHNSGSDVHNIMGLVRPGLLGSREEFLREWGGGDKGRISNPDGLAAFLRENGAMVGSKIPPGEVIRQTHIIDCDHEVLRSHEIVNLAEILLSESTPHTDRWRAQGEFDWKLRQATGIAKAPFVAGFVDMLLESTDKVLLLGWHREVYKIWDHHLRRRGHRPVMYTGSESINQKEASRLEFVEGNANVLMMSLRSGAGLDGLQHVCNNVVFGELDWVHAVHRQAIGRLRRPGQDKAVNVFYLAADDGADPVMVDTLAVKDQQAAPFEQRTAESLSGGSSSNIESLKQLAQQVLDIQRGNGPVSDDLSGRSTLFF